jgi:hypothetical protein
MLKIERIQEKLQPNILSKTFKSFGKENIWKGSKNPISSEIRRSCFKTIISSS